jgi:hypothetical protein
MNILLRIGEIIEEKMEERIKINMWMNKKKSESQSIDSVKNNKTKNRKMNKKDFFSFDI